jgi:hypothetical protein
MVTTEPANVTAVNCPACDSATRTASFAVQGAMGLSLRVQVPITYQPRFNVKKQIFVPSLGSMVVVQGRLQQEAAGRFLVAKRFGERDHAGPTVHAYDVAQSSYATGTYAWLAPVKVLNVARWNDGDHSFDVRDPAGGGLLHLESSPPFWDQIQLPHKGDVVRPYGLLRYDPEHGWWEIHPVRCWAERRCVPLQVDYLRNGPPPGTPVKGGSYLEGGPEPLRVPLRPGTVLANKTMGPDRVELLVQGADKEFVNPGRTLLIDAAAFNHGPQTLRLRLNAIVEPSSWRVEVRPSSNLTVVADGSTSFDVVVTAPASAATGDSAAVTVTALPDVGDPATLVFEVPATREVDLPTEEGNAPSTSAAHPASVPAADVSLTLVLVAAAWVRRRSIKA